MDSIRKFNLREPKSTDRKLDFQTYHDLVMAVARELGVDVSKATTPTVIRMIELDEDLPAYSPDATPDATTNNKPHIDKKGTVCYYDDTTQKWERDDTQQKVNICNPYLMTGYSKAQRIPFIYLAQAGKWIPLTVPSGCIACWSYYEVPAYACIFMKSVLDPTTITENPVMRVSRFGLTEKSPQAQVMDEPPEVYDPLDPYGELQVKPDTDPPEPDIPPATQSFAAYADDLTLYYPRSSKFHVGPYGWYASYLNIAFSSARTLANGPTVAPAKTIFLARQPMLRPCWMLYDETRADPEDGLFYPRTDSWGLDSVQHRFYKSSSGTPSYHSPYDESSLIGILNITTNARGYMFRRIGRPNKTLKIVPVLHEPFAQLTTEAYT